MIIFDIETGPLPLAEIERMEGEFDENSVPHPGEFDPDSVKLGNTKDELKVAAKMKAAQEEHQRRLAGYSDEVKNARESRENKLIGSAALKATTGRVVAIGYLGKPSNQSIIHGLEGEIDEATILRAFWSQFEKCRSERRRMVGFNIEGFDLPFLMRRTWKNGFDVPETVQADFRYFDRVFVDLRKVWNCGAHQGKGTLDEICRFFGIEGKPEDGTTGADFARLWDEDRPRAEAYLKNDLRMTSELAEKLGIY